MKLAAARNAILVSLAAGLFFVTGCSSENSCSLTPEVQNAPRSCTLAPNQEVTVRVNLCNCTAAATCEVRFGGAGVIELEPRVTSCDATCDSNTSSCEFDSLSCTFEMPSGGFNHIYVYSGGFDYVDVPLTIAGSATTCS